MIDGIVSSVSFEDIPNYRCSTLSAQQANCTPILETVEYNGMLECQQGSTTYTSLMAGFNCIRKLEDTSHIIKCL